jgi:hypothetical protein
MTERLIADYECVPAGRVLAIVALCRSDLLCTGVRGDALIVATEATVRARMDAWVGQDRAMAARVVTLPRERLVDLFIAS